MHHHGPRSLGINEKLKIKRQPDNPYDSKACAILDPSTGRILAYAERSSARMLSNLIDNNIPDGDIYIKAKYEPVVKTKRKGPQQHCYVAFKIHHERKVQVESFLKKEHISFYYHKK